jgi:phosphoribosylformimino-5-aminoimidazole carboxamide ribotide isomerase
MSDFTIYPAIDLRDGKVVRLKEGDPARMTFYSDDPAKTARHWLEIGPHWLHVVNLDGAFGESDLKNQAALESILSVAGEFKAKVQFGGGLRSLKAMRRALDMGVGRLVLGTIAIEQPEMVFEAIGQFGAEKIVVGIDARDGFVRVRGWKDKSGVLATDLAFQMRDGGVKTIIFTDISRDGLGEGLNIRTTQGLAKKSKLDVIASGGVHTLEDVLAARDASLAGVIVGRAIYDGTLDLGAALDGVSDAG